MTVITGSKDEPYVDNTGAATFASDLQEIAGIYAAGRTFRRFATQAALESATGMAAHDLAMVESIPGAYFRYAASWVMHGTALFADSSARNAAITSPGAGMRSRLASRLYDEVYVASAWRPATAHSVIKPTVAGTGVSVADDGLVTFTTASSISLNGLSGFRKVRVEVEVTAASANNLLNIRLRTSAPADDSNAKYDWEAGVFTSSTASAVPSTAQTSWLNFAPATAQTYSLVMDFEALDQARMTRMLADVTMYSTSGIPTKGIFSASHRDSTAFDGITLITNTGTATGTVRVTGIV